MGTISELRLELVLATLKVILKREEKIMATLDQILDIVKAQTTKIDSIDTLMDGLRAQLAEALSGAVLPPEVQAKVDAVFDAAKANTEKIDAAIAENTQTPEPIV